MNKWLILLLLLALPAKADHLRQGHIIPVTSFCETATAILLNIAGIPSACYNLPKDIPCEVTGYLFDIPVSRFITLRVISCKPLISGVNDPVFVIESVFGFKA